MLLFSCILKRAARGLFTLRGEQGKEPQPPRAWRPGPTSALNDQARSCTSPLRAWLGLLKNKRERLQEGSPAPNLLKKREGLCSGASVSHSRTGVGRGHQMCSPAQPATFAGYPPTTPADPGLPLPSLTFVARGCAFLHLANVTLTHAFKNTY